MRLALHRRPAARPVPHPPAWLDEPLRATLPGGATGTDALRRLSACYAAKIDRAVADGRLDLVAELSDCYLDEAWQLASRSPVQD